MIIIVDANILFSALITPNGKISEIITYPTSNNRIISCHYAIVELFKHQPKIIKYSRRSQEESLNILEILLKNIEFYNEVLIERADLIEAEKLTSGVDHFDTKYVALTLQTGGLLWTGDKKLTMHLKAMGFSNVVNTSELYELLDIG